MIPPPIPAVILAGGAARRMGGGDKCLLPLGQARVIDHLLARLTPQVGAVALNANGDPARFADLGLPVLPDPLPDRPGPLAGVLAALDWAAGLGTAGQGAARVLVVAGDTPLIPPDLARRLGAHPGLVLAASVAGGVRRLHPTVALWPVGLRADLAATLAAGDRRVMSFVQRHAPGVAEWDAAQHDPFLNLNTPEDLLRAGALV